jgi:hypothetical protein
VGCAADSDGADLHQQVEVSQNDHRKDITMTSMTRTRRIVTSAVGLAVASVIVNVVMFTSSPTSSAMPSSPPTTSSGNMPGMDHSSGDMPGMDRGTGDMPGMDHGTGDMPGMDHGTADMPGMDHSSPTPTMSGEMPGMDHGSGTMPTSSPSPTMADDMPGMSHEHSSGGPDGKTDEHGSADMPGMDHGTAAGTTKDRPLAPVLGTFGGGMSAVLLSAGFLRRKDRARAQAKQAARAARRTQK